MTVFTVITITRNCDRTILETLNSVSSQDYSNISHIIIDGRSTDSTTRVVRDFFHQKSCILYQQQSHGIAAAFNQGIRQATGDLVLFLNAGDSFVDNKVVTHIVNSYSQEHWLWSFGETISLSRRRLFRRYVRQYSSWQQLLFLYGNPMCHQSTVFSRSFLKQVGFYDENLSLAMDYDFNVRASSISQPHLLRFPISYYDTTGISSKKVFQIYKMHRVLRKKYFRLSWSHNLAIDGICFLKTVKRLFMIPIKQFL